MNIDQIPTHLTPTNAEREEISGNFGALMASKIIEWLAVSSDNRPFHKRDIEKEILLKLDKTSPEYNILRGEQINRALVTLCKADIIERAPNMNYGWYRPVNKELVEMDVQGAEGEEADIWLPLGLSDKIKLFPGDIAIFAGVPNVGKSAFSLNIAKENGVKDYDVRYFNSEMSSIELRERVEMFSEGWGPWENVKFYRRSGDFHDVVFPGRNNINIIDFLQVHDDFYRIGHTLFEIHRRLNESICIINMQKNPGQDTALGGYRTLELPRLAVAIESGTAKIVKAKAWKNKDANPNGSKCKFKLVHGHNLIPGEYMGVDFKWRSTQEAMEDGVK